MCPVGMGTSSVPSSPVGVDGLFNQQEIDAKRCSAVIKKLCTSGNINDVFAVLEDMLHKGLEPDIKTVKTIMRACVKRLAW